MNGMSYVCMCKSAVRSSGGGGLSKRQTSETEATKRNKFRFEICCYSAHNILCVYWIHTHTQDSMEPNELSFRVKRIIWLWGEIIKSQIIEDHECIFETKWVYCRPMLHAQHCNLAGGITKCCRMMSGCGMGPGGRGRHEANGVRAFV